MKEFAIGFILFVLVSATNLAGGYFIAKTEMRNEITHLKMQVVGAECHALLLEKKLEHLQGR